MKEKFPIVTTATFFNEVVKAIKVNGEYPDILDYHCADKYSVKEIKDIDFDVRTSLMFGSNEGIYLDVYLEGDIGYCDKEVRSFSLGSFKTLGESKEDMRKMGILAADFVFAAKEYAKVHHRELLRIGYYVDIACDKKNMTSLWLNCKHVEEAIEKTKERLVKYNKKKATLTDCYTGEETIVEVFMTVNELKQKKGYEFECNMSEEYATYHSCDEWGCAYAWLGNVGVEYNFCIDSSSNKEFNCCAIYKMELNNATDCMETDHSTYIHYEVDFTNPNWRAALENALCNALIKLHNL